MKIFLQGMAQDNAKRAPAQTSARERLSQAATGSAANQYEPLRSDNHCGAQPLSGEFSMRFARFVLVVQAVIMIAFSLAYWLRPYEMANLNGMLLMETASVSHMRVYYGGLQLGLALFLLWAMRVSEHARAALVMLVITMLALAAGRLGSLWLDGGELIGFDLASLIYRVGAALLAAVALLMMRERLLTDSDSDSDAEPDAEFQSKRTRLDDGPPKPFRLGDGPAPVTTAEPAPAPFRRGDPDAQPADMPQDPPGR
jgi:hypothetical protein